MEIGKVVEIKNDKAIIELAPKSLCSKCGLCSSKNGDFLITAQNELGAKAGDAVRVELKGISGLKAASIVYLIPIIFIFAGYFFGLFIYSLTDILAISIIFGTIIFLLAFLIIYLYDKRLSKGGKILFKVVEIIEQVGKR